MSKFFIKLSELRIPKECKDRDLKILLSNLLNKFPNQRLCNYKKIVSDPYYNNFSFEELINMNLPSAYSPKIKNEQQVIKNLPFLNYMKKKEDFDTRQYELISKDDQHIFNVWFDKF